MSKFTPKQYSLLDLFNKKEDKNNSDNYIFKNRKEVSFKDNPFHNKYSSNPSILEVFAKNFPQSEDNSSKNRAIAQLFKNKKPIIDPIYATSHNPSGSAQDRSGHSEKIIANDMSNAYIQYLRNNGGTVDRTQSHTLDNLRKTTSVSPSGRRYSIFPENDDLHTENSYLQPIQQSMENNGILAALFSELNLCSQPPENKKSTFKKKSAFCEPFLQQFLPQDSHVGYHFEEKGGVEADYLNNYRQNLRNILDQSIVMQDSLDQHKEVNKLNSKFYNLIKNDRGMSIPPEIKKRTLEEAILQYGNELDNRKNLLTRYNNSIEKDDDNTLRLENVQDYTLNDLKKRINAYPEQYAQRLANQQKALKQAKKIQLDSQLYLNTGDVDEYGEDDSVSSTELDRKANKLNRRKKDQTKKLESQTKSIPSKKKKVKTSDQNQITDEQLLALDEEYQTNRALYRSMNPDQARTNQARTNRFARNMDEEDPQENQRRDSRSKGKKNSTDFL